MSDEATAPSLFSRAGGMPFFERLVDAFYAEVADDPVLAPLYPEHPDFTGARHRLTLFLVQYWGGPTTYSDERGHPGAADAPHAVPRSGRPSATTGSSTWRRAVDEVCDDAVAWRPS